MIRHILVAAAVLGLSVPTAEAGDSPLLWMDNSVSGLVGTGFEVTGDDANTLTLEHASGWSFGDLFAFVDITDFKDNPFEGSSWYGEVSPRFSLGKTGILKMPEGGPVTDILIAGTFERGEHGVEALLVGPGFDWKLPGFSYFQTNFYARKDTSLGAGFEDAQMTVAFARPFQIGGQKFLVDGFMDYVVGWGPQRPSVHVVPQVKWQLMEGEGLKKVYLGVEVDYWHNKFGIRDSASFDTNQLAISALLKAHF